jgi:hypothetical protein
MRVLGCVLPFDVLPFLRDVVNLILGHEKRCVCAAKRQREAEEKQSNKLKGCGCVKITCHFIQASFFLFFFGLPDFL